MSGPRGWREAWQDAARAFYTTGAATAPDRATAPAAAASALPARHFATAANDGDALARLVMLRLAEADDGLGRPHRLDLVDVGCGGGELLAEVHRRLDCPLAEARGWRTRLALRGVDLRPRPRGLVPEVDWVVGAAPEAVPHGAVGLLLAHELLDDVPCDVVQLDDAGVLREVLVDIAGHEHLGAAVPVDDPRARWLRRWWPLVAPGDRAEVGTRRDEVALALAERLDAGVLVVVDYAHDRDARAVLGGHGQSPRGARGTLTGYVGGRRVDPVPDGSMNLTAHVALDACAAALAAASPHDDVRLSTVAGAAGAAPGHDLEATTPPTTSTLGRLAQDSRWRTLRDPHGWGGFGLLELRRTR